MLISNCPLCEEHSLNVVGEEEEKVMQCLNCGYVSNPQYLGSKETNEAYKKLRPNPGSWNRTMVLTNDVIRLKGRLDHILEHVSGKRMNHFQQNSFISKGIVMSVNGKKINFMVRAHSSI